MYFCLLDAWLVKHQPPQGLPAARLPKCDEWHSIVKGIMKSIVENPADFVANALTPLVSSIATHHAMYAVDVMNEPEETTSDT